VPFLLYRLPVYQNSGTVGPERDHIGNVGPSFRRRAEWELRRDVLDLEERPGPAIARANCFCLEPVSKLGTTD
jgi:hypothetical protein